MRRLLLLVFGIMFSVVGKTQLLNWTPPFPVEADAAQVLIITLDATKGNRGLENYTPTSDVYVHIGVITNFSSTSADWKYVKFAWGSTNPQANANYLGSNKWQYTITGSLRSFFGITNAGETIQKIAILFRNGSGSLKHSNIDGSDMYIPIYTSSLAVRITTPPSQPLYQPIPEPQNWTLGTNINIQAASNKTAALKLFHNGVEIGSAASATSVSGSSTITAYGNQRIIAEANDGTIRRDTLNVFVRPATIPQAPLPAGTRDGINYEPGDTSAILVLYAPNKSFVTVIGDFNNWLDDLPYVMNRTPDGTKYWVRITGLTPGTEYAFQYKVDDTIRIADPYTHKVLDPFADGAIPAATYPNLKPYPFGKTNNVVSILQTAKPAYNWAVNNFTRPDKKRLIIYELLLRDFVSAHDWKTLRDTLSYLKRLGVNAIELMPPNEFEGNVSWGYNTSFHFAPDKYYGPENHLKEFIDSCHKNGIAVIMDMVMNHVFGLSPLVRLYANNQGWPTAQNPWLNPDQDAATPDYQGKHPFGVGYDFNHESAATKYYFSRVVEHWLQEYKIDGYRFDLSKGFTQVYTGTNEPAWSATDPSRIAIWKGYYDTLQLKSPGSYVILEHFAADAEEVQLSNYGMLLWGNANHNFLEASMGWIDQSNFERGIFTTRGFTQPHLVTYMESHDEERLMFKNVTFGRVTAGYSTRDTNTALKRAEMSAAFLMTIPGPKMIWQFGELGYDYSITSCHPGNTIPQPYPNMQCRLVEKPIRWDYQQEIRRKRLFDVYASLNKLRLHPWYHDAFVSNRIDRDLGGGFKSMRITTDTSNLVIIGNFDVVPLTGTVVFQNAGTWYDYLQGSTFTATGGAQSITLQPGEFHIYLNRNLTNAVTTPVITVPSDPNAIGAVVYPVPVTSTATLKINLPESSNVIIELINSTGQRVNMIHQGFMMKGTHVLNMESFRNVPAGNYIVRINAGTKKSFVSVVKK